MTNACYGKIVSDIIMLWRIPMSNAFHEWIHLTEHVTNSYFWLTYVYLFVTSDANILISNIEFTVSQNESKKIM